MASDKQLGYARAVVDEGRRLGITERGLLIALATVLVECDLIMYANAKVPASLKLPHERIGNDGYSVGLFQQQVVWGNGGWWWGDAATCMDPTLSARLFFQRLAKLDYNNTNRSPGKFAQDVQGSAYPDRYDKRMAEATELYKALGGTKETVMGWSGDPVWLAEVLKAEGLDCAVFDGAFDRGQGDFGGIWGIVAHHTGSNPPSNNPGYIAKHPTLGLASQLHLARDGKWTLCGVGIAYHAGSGSWPGIAKNNANAVTIGIEAENNGTEGWSDAQYKSYVRGVAAILRRLGHQSDRVIGHKEWGAIQGKWDPGGIDMNAFRRDVQAAIDRKAEAPIVNEINEAAKRAPWVGARVRPEEIAVGSDGKGRLGVYENAHIYFYPGIGAFPIPGGGLFEAYAALDYERGQLGYPVREFALLDGVTGKGGVQAFQGGVLYRKEGAGTGYIVHGEIGKRWAAEGYELGALGWPTSNEGVDANGNRYQLFEHGSLYWHSTGVTKLSKVG
ncbi:N-acetylmuramoyl-L-alanine amidase [Rhodococcus sp. NPDC057297]|uniref:N-acetylmuramoyl-L-alanine amidase n=1 Tax=Rhodococcus sp. NPDC057297 TaxID=3346090 RepID=UPI00364195A6